MKLKSTLLTILLLGAGFAVYGVYRTREEIHNSYAVWWAADMVIEHMKIHDGKWPAGWEDLREPYEICAEQSGRPWTFEELQERVAIDWHADPNNLAMAATKNGKPTFRVIWLRDGSDAHWKEREPNKMVYDYLKKSPSTGEAIEFGAEW